MRPFVHKLLVILSLIVVSNALASGREREPAIIRGPAGPAGRQGPVGPRGPTGETGPGLTGSVYVIPANSVITFNTANGHVSLNASCNYGSSGDNEVFFSALDESVTAGSVLVNMDLAGQVQSFSDLYWGGGGMDRGFPNTSYQGTWPWHGVFTVNEGGTLSRWEIFMNGANGQNCTATVFSFGAGTTFCTPISCT